MVNFINLTPHSIRIRIEESSVLEPLESDIVLEPSGNQTRIAQESNEAESINGIRIMQTVFNDIVGLPEPSHNVAYIVSLPVAQQATAMGRGDVYCPDTSPNGGALRYQEGPLKGQPFAVRGLQQFL